MRFIYITLLFLFIIMEGQSQTWNEWEQCYENDNPVFICRNSLDNKIEMLGDKKKAEKLYQQKIRFPIELKDTLCKILDSEFIHIRVIIRVDTMGKAKEFNVWHHSHPFVSAVVEKILKKYPPEFTPPIYKSKKVESEIYYVFAFSTKKKIRNLKAPHNKFYIYPVFENLQK